MPAPKVQISIQGGGAKFATLLPAVDAALEVHNTGIVEITRVSGSSAGAIAAALIAAKADFGKIDQILNDPKTLALITALNTKLPKAMSDKPTHRHFGYIPSYGTVKHIIFRSMNRFALVRRLIKGESIEDISTLRALLEHLFIELCGYVPTTFQALHASTGITLRVTSSDILGQEGRVVEAGSVVQALLESCALPIFYRNYTHLEASPVIDGGICDNLPIQHLKDQKNKFGEIFAFCLVPNKRPGILLKIPTSIFAYAWAIWTAVAADAVKRTRSMLNSQHIVDLETDISLTDFVGAMNNVREREKYDSLKDKVVTKFVDYAKVQSFGEISENVTISGHLDPEAMMSAIFGVYKKHFENNEIRLKRSAFIVRADSLDRFSGGKSRRADQVTREAIFVLPTEMTKPLNCIRSFIDTESGSYTSTRWTVEFIKSKRTVKPTVIPADDDGSILRNAIDCLLFFDEPLVGNEEDGYELRISSHYAKSGAMLPLEKNGSDIIGATNGHTIIAERVDIVLCTPKQVGPIAVSRDPRLAQTPKGHHVTEPAVLDEYRYLQGADYNVTVFTAENVRPSERVVALFTRIS